MQLIQQITRAVIIAGCLGATAAVLANMIILIMIGKVNSRLPDDEKLPNYILDTTRAIPRYEG
jgi:hypothetical protein